MRGALLEWCQVYLLEVIDSRCSGLYMILWMIELQSLSIFESFSFSNVFIEVLLNVVLFDCWKPDETWCVVGEDPVGSSW